MKNNLRRWELALLMALCITALSGVWAVRTQNGLASKLIRLHVIADSDGQEAQELKLEVRDRILEMLEPELEGAASRTAAEEIIREKLPEIQQIARETAGDGGDYNVSATLDYEGYPTRQYEGFALPAGEYLSLRVTLGRGEGRNWWCVVFPPLCMSAAEESQPASAVLSEDDTALIEGEEGYVLKFKLVELWGEIREALR